MKKYYLVDGKVHSRDEKFAHLMPDGCEEITDAEAAQIIADNTPAPDPSVVVKQELAATDADMPRIIEDMWSALVAKGVVSDSDLPQVSQDKLNNRRNKRASLSS